MLKTLKWNQKTLNGLSRNQVELIYCRIGQDFDFRPNWQNGLGLGQGVSDQFIYDPYLTQRVLKVILKRKRSEFILGVIEASLLKSQVSGLQSSDFNDIEIFFS